MKFIKLTNVKETYFINCDRIHHISANGSITYVVFDGVGNYATVDQTPEEILELIKKEDILNETIHRRTGN
jgi:hypothetical protein